MVRAHTYLEKIVLEEIERALDRGDLLAVQSLDRVRDAAGLPADERVIFCLHLIAAEGENR